MRFFEWLRGRTPDLTSDAPAISIKGIGAHDDPVTVEAADSPEIATPARDQEPAEIADYFCAIEYRDAAGAFSRRRVTLRRAYAADAGHYIDAICHERKALRTFRTDRILSVIDQFGEIHDARMFFTETFGLDLSTATINREHKEAEGLDPNRIVAQRAAMLRKRLHAELTLLVAIARSDSSFHIEELDAIEQFVEDSAARLVEAGNLPDVFGPPEFDCLRPIIKGMRPQRDSLDGCVRALLSSDNASVERFLNAAHAVVQADGIIAEAEIDMLDWLNDARSLIESEWRNNATRPDLTGQTFFFTGTLASMSRNAAQAAVTALGGTAKGTVTSYGTPGKTYLVAGANSGSKVRQAKKFGIPSLNEAEFLRLIGMG